MYVCIELTQKDLDQYQSNLVHLLLTTRQRAQ